MLAENDWNEDCILILRKKLRFSYICGEIVSKIIEIITSDVLLSASTLTRLWKSDNMDPPDDDGSKDYLRVLAEQKLRSFSIGNMGRQRGISKKEQEEIKKKQDQVLIWWSLDLVTNIDKLCQILSLLTRLSATGGATQNWLDNMDIYYSHSTLYVNHLHCDISSLDPDNPDNLLDK